MQDVSQAVFPMLSVEQRRRHGPRPCPRPGLVCSKSAGGNRLPRRPQRRCLCACQVGETVTLHDGAPRQKGAGGKGTSGGRAVCRRPHVMAQRADDQTEGCSPATISSALADRRALLLLWDFWVIAASTKRAVPGQRYPYAFIKSLLPGCGYGARPLISKCDR